MLAAVILLVIPCALGKSGHANLRGQSESEAALTVLSQHQQPVKTRTGKSPVMYNMNQNAKRHEDIVSNFFEEVKNKALSPQQGDKKPTVARPSHTILDNGNPDPTYDSFLVSRKRLGVDCKGPGNHIRSILTYHCFNNRSPILVESLVATNMACIKSGRQSMAGWCSQDTWNTYVNFDVFDSSDCSGGIIGNSTDQYTRDGCQSGDLTYQCISRTELPPFVQKQGLYT